jgi:WD40 repeat protein
MHLVAFSQNGKLIAIASGTVVTVWDSESGRKLRPLSGQLDTISSVAFRPPDGAYLATASHDGTTRLWDVGSGQVVLDLFIGPAERISDVAFSKDGQYLATTGVRTLRQYPLNMKKLLTVAQQFATRSLRTDECREYLQRERCPPVQ